MPLTYCLCTGCSHAQTACFYISAGYSYQRLAVQKEKYPGFLLHEVKEGLQGADDRFGLRRHSRAKQINACMMLW